MKLAGILRHINTNLEEKFEQKKNGIIEKLDFEYFRKTDANLLF